MRVLIVKLSSMGDVIHTLPAVTDAAKALPGIVCDWAIEPGFSELPKLHSSVNKVIPIALRKWRTLKAFNTTPKEFIQAIQQLRSTQYDVVLDAQGLLKSSVITRLAQGNRVGLDRHSAREPLASLLYQKTVSVDPKWHAIRRVRTLFAKALGYSVPEGIPNYGLNISVPNRGTGQQPYLVFVHGTTWGPKHWPESHWEQLRDLATKKGFCIKLPWGNTVEKARAERLAAPNPLVEVLPQMSILELLPILSQALGVVSVDTGLGHLTAALGKTNVSLYGPTNPDAIGAMGDHQVHLSEASMGLISAERVWALLSNQVGEQK